MRFLALLLCATLACALPATATEPPITTELAIAGDSVVLTVAIADDLGAQPVSVDSILVTAGLGQFGSDRTARVAKVAGVTTARLAWPLSAWGPNQALGSAIRVTLGHIAVVSAACPSGVCWSGETTGPSWSYTLDATAPNPAPPEAITVESVGLN